MEYSALTTLLYNRHAICYKKQRYTTYEDGAKEYYDHVNGLLEWKNLTKETQYDCLKYEVVKYSQKVTHRKYKTENDSGHC